MAWLFICFSAIIAFSSWTAISLLRNYQAARQIGLPLIVSPITPLNPFWILTYRFSPIISLLKPLPWGLGKFARCIYIGWQFDDKYALHEELGDAFILVTPGTNELILADPDAVNLVLARRKEYIKPAVLYEQLNVFGPTVNTVEGDIWQRHRKITAPSFNENVSNSVWNEATRQCQDMLQTWIQQGSKGTPNTVEDTAVLALHVLTYAGFGMQYPFSEGVQSPWPGHVMAYRNALLQILQNIIALQIFPQRFLRSSLCWSKNLRDLGQATLEFRKYMEEMLSRERQLISEKNPGAGNLMSALVRASEDAKGESETQGITSGLDDDEIFGNIFMYNLAGHETTANTVAYAIVLLAAYPEWQEWLAEEITCVLGDDKNGNEKCNYEDAFPKLKRCLVTMYEVLRLNGSIVFIPKETGFHHQTLTIQNKPYTIPAHTFVTTNNQALHTNPRTWGPDASTFRPGRWIKSSPKISKPKTSKPFTSATDSESIIEPSKGTFVPWADGPRACPGRKFAQVEFVALMAGLFRHHRVRPALVSEQETAGQAQKRLLAMVNDSAISAITLQMQHPKSVSLVWSRKG